MDEYELYHHGIRGMKWGVRRFQPYPSDHKGGKETGEAAKVSKRKLTNQQKANIAIGVGSAAAIGSLTYVALKQRKKIISLGKEYAKTISDNDAKWFHRETKLQIKNTQLRQFIEENGLEIPLYILRS